MMRICIYTLLWMSIHRTKTTLNLYSELRNSCFVWQPFSPIDYFPSTRLTSQQPNCIYHAVITSFLLVFSDMGLQVSCCSPVIQIIDTLQTLFFYILYMCVCVCLESKQRIESVEWERRHWNNKDKRGESVKWSVRFRKQFTFHHE